MTVMPPPDDDELTLVLDAPKADGILRDHAKPGDRIGPYRLIHLLGEGGMGQVFLAEQREPIRRQVALKLIQRQLAGSLAEAYFEVEWQALARMDHPAIAKVLDAGRTPDGFPYFAMEYVEGRPLDQWRREDAPDERTRLRAIIALAYGVQHAHQRGIVHRDVKPTNVIMAQVDGRPQPKLIDFGIAVGIDLQLDASSRSNYERAGSGPYMSPEQFAGDAGSIDIRTDIYSIGMVLLSVALPLPGLRSLGDPPPQREALHERIDAVLAKRGDDAVLDAVPSDLLHIIATAIHPQRERRYASTMAFAQDLQRYLDGYAVEAVPATTGYRMRKFARRRRRPLIMAAAAVLALVGGLGVAIWGLIEAEQQARRSQATADFLSTVLAGVNPDRARDLDKTLLREVLDTAALRAADELRDLPDALAEIESVIAGSYQGLGEFDDAEKHARRAYELMVQTYGRESERTLAAARQYGRARIDTGDLQDAEAFLRDAVITSSRELGADAPITLRLRQTLGWALRESGQYPAAFAEAESTAARQAQTLGADHEDTLETRFSLAIALADLERWDESADLLKELIAIRTQTNGPEDTTTLTLRNSLAVTYLQSRRFAEGEIELRGMIPIYERVFGDDSSMTLMLKGNMGGALRQQGKVDESGPFYQAAADAYLERFGPEHPRSIQSLHNYANYLYDARRYDEAYAAQRQAAEQSIATFGERHPVRAEALHGLGRAATALGRYQEAEAALIDSLAIKEEALGKDSTRLQVTRDALAELYDMMQRPEDAERYRAPDNRSTTAGET